MDKWTGRYLMMGAVILQTVAATAYVFAVESDGGTILLGIPLSIVSLLLFGRGARVAAEPTPPAPEAAPPQPRLEEMILNLQEDVNRLREDREFYRELYAEEPGHERDGMDRLPSRERAMTYRLVPERLTAPRPPSAGR